MKATITVFPARAGMSPHCGDWIAYRTSVPRASGDEPSSKPTQAPHQTCSPRERG